MKKAFMKTIEMMLVIVMTAILVFVVFPKSASRFEKERISYLSILAPDENFRSFATANTGCFNKSMNTQVDSMIGQYLPKEYDYIFCLDSKPYSLPLADVTVDSLYFAGNITNIDEKTLWLYYWINR